MLRLSAKKKRKVYSISSLLLHLLVFIALLLSLNACELPATAAGGAPACGNTLATLPDRAQPGVSAAASRQPAMARSCDR